MAEVADALDVGEIEVVEREVVKQVADSRNAAFFEHLRPLRADAFEILNGGVGIFWLVHERGGLTLPPSRLSSSGLTLPPAGPCPQRESETLRSRSGARYRPSCRDHEPNGSWQLPPPP